MIDSQEEDNTLGGFIKSIKKVSKKRIHSASNSYGVYDGYKFYRESETKYTHVNRLQYGIIIRSINKLLGEALINGEDILLPHRLGRIEIRKYKPSISLNNGKVKTTLPIDWNRTLKLWYEDKESYKNKTLIKVENKEVFRVYYNRVKAEFENKSFYRFNINRELKNKLKQNIREGKLDAFNFNYG